MFGVLCVVVFALVSIGLSLTDLFGGNILWLVAMVAGLVLVSPLVVLGAKKMARTMETAAAKKLTSLACVCYGLLVIPAVFLLRSIIIVGEGSISAFWILFLIAAFDAFVFVKVAGSLNGKAEALDREALDEVNA